MNWPALGIFISSCAVIAVVCGVMRRAARRGRENDEQLRREIAERRQAQEALVLDEARLESLLKISQHKAKDVQGLLDFALEAGMKIGTRLGLGFGVVLNLGSSGDRLDREFERC